MSAKLPVISVKQPWAALLIAGVKTADVQDSKYAQGPFALQFGNRANDAPGGVIKWRKVQIKPL